MAKLCLALFTDFQKDIWNEYVTNNSYAQVYHLWEWGDVLCKTYGYRRYYLAVQCGEDVVGVLPLLYISSKIFGSKLVSLPFCEYGGPLVGSALDSGTIKTILATFSKGLKELMQKLGVDYVQLREPPSSVSSFLPFFGFSPFEHYITFRMDLTKGEAVLWRSLKRDVRKGVKRALKAEIRIKDVNADHLTQFYNLYLETQRRHGSPPHSLDFFENVYKAFKPKGQLRMVLAMYGDVPVAGELFFCFNEKINCWSNVSDRRFGRLYPTNLIFWHIIKWGIEINFKILDRGRTRREAKGIYFFKSRWGGLQVPLKDYVLSTSKLKMPDPLQRRYVLLSRVWSLLPQALACQLGPMVISKIGL